jgi:5-methylcytosine-specific restriction endonuclease McrA
MCDVQSKEGVQVKTCRKCQRQLSLSVFYTDRRASDGRGSQCKECVKASAKAWYEANLERAKATRASYAKENAEHLAQKAREWQKANQDAQRAKAKARYELDRQAYIDRAAAWRKANRERFNAHCRACYRRTRPVRLAEGARHRAENRDRINARNRAYAKAHPLERAARVRAWRARRRAGGMHTAAEVVRIWHRQRGECACCGARFGRNPAARGFDVDHVRPLSRGGSNLEKNLQLLCPTCNRSKGARYPAEHRLALRRSALASSWPADGRACGAAATSRNRRGAPRHVARSPAPHPIFPAT